VIITLIGGISKVTEILRYLFYNIVITAKDFRLLSRFADI